MCLCVAQISMTINYVSLSCILSVSSLFKIRIVSYDIVLFNFLLCGIKTRNLVKFNELHVGLWQSEHRHYQAPRTRRLSSLDLCYCNILSVDNYFQHDQLWSPYLVFHSTESEVTK